MERRGTDRGAGPGKETLLISQFCQGSVLTGVNKRPNGKVTIGSAELKLLVQPWEGQTWGKQGTALRHSVHVRPGASMPQS